MPVATRSTTGARPAEATADLVPDSPELTFSRFDIAEPPKGDDWAAVTTESSCVAAAVSADGVTLSAPDMSHRPSTETRARRGSELDGVVGVELGEGPRRLRQVLGHQ